MKVRNFSTAAAALLALASNAKLAIAADQPVSNPIAVSGIEIKQLIPTNLDGYPSIIQISGKAMGGPADTQFVLQCGIAPSADHKKAVFNPTIVDFSLLSESTGRYSRYQKIDDSAVVSLADPASVGKGGLTRLLVEVSVGGKAVAKNCQINTNTDSLLNCTPIAPFLTPDKVVTQVAAATQRCVDIMTQDGGQIDPATIEPNKTAALKARRQQALKTLEAQ
jgi:hypothetical protein